MTRPEAVQNINETETGHKRGQGGEEEKDVRERETMLLQAGFVSCGFPLRPFFTEGE